MTVRFKIALTIFLTGLLTAVGVVATVLFAFERFDHESTYYRANAFLERVVLRHNDMFAMRERFADDFNGFLSNLVLFEPDTQLYLLAADGTVLGTSSDMPLPKGFKVAIQPVMDAAGSTPMPYVLGDDPERMDASAVIAARALRPTVIRNDAPLMGYLYLVSHKIPLQRGAVAAFSSTFLQPALILILAVVALATAVAAWVTAAVTRPLAKLTAVAASVSRHGLEDFSANAGSGAAANFGLAETSAKDEFGQLNNGIRKMLTTLQAQWATLRRLDHFRREGVSNLSHDLRSPLTATAACLETLQNRWAGDAARSSDQQLVDVALRNTHNAARLVHSLGDLAQLDEPAFKLNTQVMDVSELLDDVALRFTERAARRGVAIHSGLPSQLANPNPNRNSNSNATVDFVPPTAAVDVELFERAIANLVDNALKFCQSGARISLEAARRDGEVQVRITDTGPGIATADLPHLFDRFYQSRQSVAPATGEGGKGLGLAIVKRIVELHGGQVRVDSAPGEGTTVTLSLPLVV
jgi:signal transduction histidine kinase